MGNEREKRKSGCAVVAEPMTFQSFADYGNEYDFPMTMAVVGAKPDKQARYYVGAGWSRSGDFADKKAWLAEVENMSQRAASPLVVSVATPEYLKNKRNQPLSHRLTNTLMNRVWLEDELERRSEFLPNGPMNRAFK